MICGTQRNRDLMLFQLNYARSMEAGLLPQRTWMASSPSSQWPRPCHVAQ